jgi:hypothetical protein
VAYYVAHASSNGARAAVSANCTSRRVTRSAPGPELSPWPRRICCPCKLTRWSSRPTAGDRLRTRQGTVTIPDIAGHQPGPVRLGPVDRDVLSAVGMHRPLGVLQADLAHAGLVRQHTLGSLPTEEAAQLLGALLVGLADRQGPLRARVRQRAGDVPFFLVSCAQGLRLRPLEADGPAVPWDVAQGVRQRASVRRRCGISSAPVTTPGRSTPTSPPNVPTGRRWSASTTWPICRMTRGCGRNSAPYSVPPGGTPSPCRCSRPPQRPIARPAMRRDCVVSPLRSGAPAPPQGAAAPGQRGTGPGPRPSGGGAHDLRTTRCPGRENANRSCARDGRHR